MPSRRRATSIWPISTSTSLSAHAVGEAASRVAVIPEVRRILVDKQRAFARGSPPGAVLDGRDIGTVVCPDADVKLYVTASRRCAPRRLRDIENRGGTADSPTILADIRRRDERDMGRADSPLGPPPMRTCSIRPKCL
jgi:cytidylate kinase